MPLMMPSIAWSSGASSNTMLAALPPSSSVSFLCEPATARAIILPTAGEQVRRQRRRARRLEDDGVTGGQRRRDLPCQHEEREVPGDDLGRHAERTGLAVGKRVLELV